MSEQLHSPAEQIIEDSENRNFDEIAKQIIKNSIRNAICIDDNYAAPYSEVNAELNSEDPKALYYSFRKEGHCDLDIYQFQNIEDWQNSDYMTHNKDLMILDWELDQDGEKYQNTLIILEDIILNKRIPFVVIYTNTEDLNNVSNVLCEKFNEFTETDYDEFINLLKHKISNLSPRHEDIDSFFEEEKKIFYEFFKFHDRREEISQEILAKLSSFLEYPNIEKLSKKIISTIKSNHIIRNEFELIDALLIISNITLSSNISVDSNNFKNIRIKIKKDCFLINGVIVLVLHKKNNHDGVNPEDLFSVFSEAIYSNPHSIVNLISLELKDKLREDFSIIGTRFNMINEKAFLYHANNYNHLIGDVNAFDKSAFTNFVIQSWMNELTQYNLDLSLQSIDLLENLLEEIPINPDLEIKLSQYANMVSCVNIENRTNKKLTFGDVFKSDTNYFICITPHCDCLNPSKIDHHFYFTIGEKTNISSALQDAEQGFYSFIFDDNEYIAIKWKCKPFTTFISEDNNDIGSLKLSHKNNSLDLNHITILKENYTQRIANNSFGYGYRVGIDLPHT